MTSFEVALILVLSTLPSRFDFLSNSKIFNEAIMHLMSEIVQRSRKFQSFPPKLGVSTGERNARYSGHGSDSMTLVVGDVPSMFGDVLANGTHTTQTKHVILV